MAHQHQCQTCGIQFETAVKISKFCSRECFRLHTQTWKRELVQCERCGTEFDATNGKSKFCSLDCYHADSQTRVGKDCAECGNKFYRAGFKTKYCSSDCYHKSHAIGCRPKKSKSPAEQVTMPTGWQHKIAPSIIARDGCCQWCQSLDSLCVHHMIDRYHNDPENCTTLCRKCHTKVTVVEQARKLVAEYGQQLFDRFLK